MENDACVHVCVLDVVVDVIMTCMLEALSRSVQVRGRTADLLPGPCKAMQTGLLTCEDTKATSGMVVFGLGFHKYPWPINIVQVTCLRPSWNAHSPGKRTHR